MDWFNSKLETNGEKNSELKNKTEYISQSAAQKEYKHGGRLSKDSILFRTSIIRIATVNNFHTSRGGKSQNFLNEDSIFNK